MGGNGHGNSTGHAALLALASYSASHRDALLGTTFDRVDLAANGLAYERLDQLTMEVLLGVR